MFLTPVEPDFKVC